MKFLYILFAALALAAPAAAVNNTLTIDTGCGSLQCTSVLYDTFDGSYDYGVKSDGAGVQPDGNDGHTYTIWFEHSSFPAGCKLYSRTQNFLSNNIGQFLGHFSVTTKACQGPALQPLPAAATQLAA